jgi:hypothetical protein
LNVDGVLTYEDVTNIDSVGVVTARAGVKVPDSQKIFLGTDNDLEIYHSSSGSFIDNTGNVTLALRQFTDNADIVLSTDDGSGGVTPYIRCDGSTGETKLNHYGSEKLSTETYGINVQGEVQCDSLDVDGLANIQGSLTLQSDLLMGDNDLIKLGASDDLQISHDGATSIINGLYHPIEIRHQSEVHIKCVDDGAVELYYDNSKKLETTSGGAILQGKLQAEGSGGSTIYELKRTDTNSTGAVGTINFTASDSHSVASMSAMGDGDNEGAHIVFRTTSAAANNSPYNAATSERLRITSAGGVTIGSGNNDSSMSEFGSNTGGLTIDDAGVSNTGIRLSHGNDDTYLVQSSNSNFYISQYGTGNMIFGVGSSGNERLRITNDGRVSINYNNPNSWAQLTVKQSGADISGTADTASNTRGLHLWQDQNDNKSIGLWFTTGGHLSGISGQRSDYSNHWGTDLRFYTHSPNTSNVTQAYERLRITDAGLIDTNGNSIRFGSNELRIVGTNDVATYGWGNQPGIYASGHQEFRMHSGSGDLDLYVDGFGYFNQGVKGAFVDADAVGSWTMSANTNYTWNPGTPIPANVWVSMNVFCSSMDSDESDHFDIVVGPNVHSGQTWGTTNAASTPSNDHSIITHLGDSQDVAAGHYGKWDHVICKADSNGDIVFTLLGSNAGTGVNVRIQGYWLDIGSTSVGG